METTTYIATLPIKSQTKELLDCMKQLSSVYNSACGYIETLHDNPSEVDEEIDNRIGQPFEDFRLAIAQLIGRSITDSLIEDGIPA